MGMYTATEKAVVSEERRRTLIRWLSQAIIALDKVSNDAQQQKLHQAPLKNL